MEAPTFPAPMTAILMGCVEGGEGRARGAPRRRGEFGKSSYGEKGEKGVHGGDGACEEEEGPSKLYLEGTVS